MNSENVKLMNSIVLSSGSQVQPTGTAAHYMLAGQNSRADRSHGLGPTWRCAAGNDSADAGGVACGALALEAED
jgi:hypothetical protein